jgi:hypothetical protein
MARGYHMQLGYCHLLTAMQILACLLMGKLTMMSHSLLCAFSFVAAFIMV